MSSKPHSGWYWIHTWWPVALMLLMISVESTEIMGADNTGHFLYDIWTSLFGPVSPGSWDHIHHYIRKTGHFVGYGLVGLSWLRAWWRTLPHSRFFADAGLALLATAVTASADEWHQGFLPNRTGTPYDVLLDCTGAVVLQLLVYIYWRITQPKRLKDR